MKRRNPLRNLTKLELLELLAEQEQEIEDLKQQLEQKNQLLAQRTLCMDEAGNLAQAALALNGVFEAAQKAADQYVESVKVLADHRLRASGSPPSRSGYFKTAAGEFGPLGAAPRPRPCRSYSWQELLVPDDREDDA